MNTDQLYIAQIKVSLRDSEPLIWRRLEVPVNLHLGKLHTIINKAMGWDNCHLHIYRIRGQVFSDPQYDDVGTWKNEKQITLIDLMTEKVKKFDYEYDLGDGWTHEVKIEKLVEADPTEKYPRCIDGENACPPEDCGGLGGFENFKEALANEKHPEHKELKSWYGRKFDPKSFDLDNVNHTIQKKSKTR